MKPPFTVMKIRTKDTGDWFYVVDGDDSRVSGPWSNRGDAQKSANRLTTEFSILSNAS